MLLYGLNGYLTHYLGEYCQFHLHSCYSLRPKKNDVLILKICPKNNDVLLNLACVHVHVDMQQSVST
jgi:hypothetical protein